MYLSVPLDSLHFSMGDLALKRPVSTKPFFLTYVKRETGVRKKNWRSGHKLFANARFTLCSRRPRQSRFRPPWTKRDGRETTRGDGMGNVTGRDCRGCRARFLNCQKICHGSHGADEKPSRP